MEMLETALAFAVAMILFSTVVSGIVEASLRAFARRPHFIALAVRRMVAELFAARPALFAAAPRDAADPARLDRAWVEGFVDAMTHNRALSDAIEAPRDGMIWYLDMLLRLVPGLGHVRKDFRRVETLSPLGFAMRLAEHEVGRAIAGSRAEREAEWRMVVRTYSRYRALTLEMFRRYARGWALVVAIGLALTFNIDAGRLINRLNADADAREKLVANPQAIADSAEAALAELGATLGGGTRPPGSDELVAALQQVSQAMQPLRQEATLPIGAGYFPHCLVFDTAPAEPLCGTFAEAGGDPEARRDLLVRLGIWTFNAVVAGVLIGLGGPFWYRVFGGLSNLANALRSVAGGQVASETFRTGEEDRKAEGGLEAEIDAVVAAVMRLEPDAAPEPAAG